MSRFESEQPASRRLRVADIQPHLMCILCGGYYVDATTIIECLHSFCKSCLVKYLETNKYCPICEVQVHKTKPLLNIRPDETLQNMVYKLVPGLFHKEMRCRQEFYAQHPDALPSSSEDRGIVDQIECQFYSPDEPVSLALEFKSDPSTSSNNNGMYKRYLRCPAAVTVAHLQKLVGNKYGLPASCRVNIMFEDQILTPDFSIMDVAYAFQRKRKEQFHFTYRIVEVQCKKRKLEEPIQKDEAVDAMDVDPPPPTLLPPGPPNLSKSAGPTQQESKSKLDSIISRLGIAKQTEGLAKRDKTDEEWKEVQLQISENGVMSVSSIDKLINTIEKNVGASSSNVAAVQKVEPASKKEAVCVHSKVVAGSTASKQLDSSPDDKGGLLPNSASAKEEINSIVTVTLEKSHNSNASDCEKKEIKKQENLPMKPAHDMKKKVEQVSKPGATEVKTVAPHTISTSSKTPTPSSTSVQQNIPVPRMLVPPASSSFSTRSNSNVSQNSVPAISSSQLCVTLGSSQVTLSISPSPSVTSSANVTPSSLAVMKTSNLAPTSTTMTRTAPVTAPKPIQTTPSSKKSSSSPVGYKTLKCGPKNWNPTISRNSFLSSKAEQQPQQQGSSTSQGSSPAGKPSTPPRFFKMRNTPRYLGNPASGVKAMYQIPDIKPETPPPAKSPSVMKLDPRTLTPIVSNASSPLSKATPNQPKGRPPFPSTTLSAQVTSNYMPSSRSVTTTTTTSSSSTKHADLSLRSSPTQPLVNPFSFMHKGMPNLLYGVGPGLLSSAAPFAGMLRPGMGYPPVTASGFHPNLPPTASLLFNPMQLHQLSSASPVSPRGYSPSPSMSLSPSSSSSSSSSLPSKNYSAGQRTNMNEKSPASPSCQSSPNRTSKSNSGSSSFPGQEFGKVNGTEVTRSSSVIPGKQSPLTCQDQKPDSKTKGFSSPVSKDVKTSTPIPSASINNNTLSISKTKPPSDKLEGGKLDVSNLLPKESGKCGDDVSRSKKPNTSFQTQQS